MSSTDTGAGTSAAQKLTFATMTAMVVGSMVGAGVFSLPRRFAQETGIAGALVAVSVVGAILGVTALATGRIAI
jgi:arginine:ornithine antiporter / lysine permease